MKKIYCFIMLITYVFLWAEPQYSLVKVYFQTPSQLEKLSKMGLDFEGAIIKKNEWVKLVVSEYDLKKIVSEGFYVETEIADLQKYYARRLKKVTKGKFGDGSIGGFYTFEEMIAQLDMMKSKYPNLISEKIIIGYTILNRPIYAVKISDNIDWDDGDPEVFYNAMHHAREPQGMMCLIYYMWWLLDNYGSDPLATYIVNNRQLWFVPMINVDGYIHNYSLYPSSIGMWRKNARDNDDDGTNFSANDGVDPNRNYSVAWGTSNGSNDPSSGEYPGTAPFSEPEVRAIKDFVESHQFKIIFNYHSYSNLYLFPWGYINVPCEDDAYFRALTSHMAQYNYYISGRPGEILYTASGTALDWEYKKNVNKAKIFSITPEVGSSDDGFWPPSDRILPLAEENLRANQIGALAAGSYPYIKHIDYFSNSFNQVIYPGSIVELIIEVDNLGVEDGKNVQVNILSHPDYKIIHDNSFNISTLKNQFLFPEAPTNKLIFKIQISPEAQAQTIPVSFSVNDDQYLFDRDTINLVIGKEKVSLFSDNFENGTQKWQQLGNWNLSKLKAKEGRFSITDSPDGNYPDNSNNSLISNEIDVTGKKNVTLEYYTYYQIEPLWDFATVEYSLDDSNTWIQIVTDNMDEGRVGAVILRGEFGYTGNSNDWVHEKVNIPIGNANTIKLRFSMMSDRSISDDGIYLDSINLYSFEKYKNIPPVFPSESDSLLPVLQDSVLIFRTIAYDDSLIDSVNIYWSFDGSEWKSGKMQPNDSIYMYSLKLTDLPSHATIRYYFKANDEQNYSSYFPVGAPDSTFQFYLDNPLDVAEETNKLSPELTIFQNYPNPFNLSTIIRYHLSANMFISLKIYNSQGQLIKTLVNEVQNAGPHSIKWDGTNEMGNPVPSGVYFYLLKSPSHKYARKLLLIK